MTNLNADQLIAGIANLGKQARMETVAEIMALLAEFGETEAMAIITANLGDGSAEAI
jgi:hypothetical protein